MPQAPVSHDDGTTPVIVGNNGRDYLILQNNTDTDIRYRLEGAVSLSDGTKSGLLLRGNGGTINLSGPLAKNNVYAVHGAGAGESRNLDFESNQV